MLGGVIGGLGVDGSVLTAPFLRLGAAGWALACRWQGGFAMEKQMMNGQAGTGDAGQPAATHTNGRIEAMRTWSQFSTTRISGSPRRPRDHMDTMYSDRGDSTAPSDSRCVEVSTTNTAEARADNANLGTTCSSDALGPGLTAVVIGLTAFDTRREHVGAVSAPEAVSDLSSSER